MTTLTPEQVQILQSLGLQSKKTPPKQSPLLPLLSISGLTFISFGGLILFKNKTTTSVQPSLPAVVRPQPDVGGPTQVPKSIQHYLLTSQQYFTSALTAQTQKDPASVIQNLNLSLTAATTAITEFPADYRGYEQRGRIYQSLLDSQPKLLTNAISDLSVAAKYNPESADITRALAILFARQGDAANTISYLTKTVNLEPTIAQNFYDLARIQQQVGQLPEALNTYARLITIISDPVQKSAVLAEKTSIEHLLTQTSNIKAGTSPSPEPSISASGPLLQASLESNLIIGAPETSKSVSVSNLVDSNSLSGTGVLPLGQKSISINNSNLNSASQVYLTVTKGGKNLSLQVLGKSKDSFVVGLDSSTTEDISFKWWIINP